MRLLLLQIGEWKLEIVGANDISSILELNFYNNEKLVDC